MRAFVLLFALNITALAASAQGPNPVWSFRVDSVVQPAPLVGDFDNSPGLETIVTGTAGRQLVCLRSNGKEAWRLEPPFAAQMSAPPALSSNAVVDGMRVAVAFGNEIASIDPKSSSVDWTSTMEDGQVHSVLWADVDGDTWHDLVVATATSVHVFDARGTETLTAEGDPDAPLAISGALAAADADLNDFAELYGAGAKGVFALDETGFTRWRAAEDTVFAGAPIVADSNGDSFSEVYAVAPDGSFLYAFDADLGDVLWRNWLPGDATPGTPSLVAGDLDSDGVGEILVGLPNGRVYAVESTGEIRWSAQPGAEAALALGLGDVNGDAKLEVLAASLDGSLYALDTKGNILWRFETGGALVHPPVLCDVDQDVKTDLVFAGRDGYVRCVTLDGRYLARALPWPELGAGPTRAYTAAAGTEDEFADDVDAGPMVVSDNRPLLPLAGFDVAAKDGTPIGWTCVSPGEAAITLDEETKLAGPSALRVEAIGGPCVVVSELVPVTAELQGVSGSINGLGDTAAMAVLRWMGAAGVVREDPLEAGQPLESGWRRFNTDQVEPPPGAQWLVLALTTESGAPAHWDGGQLMGIYERMPEAGVFHNQLGYEKGAPKYFTAWCNYQPRVAKFELIGQGGNAVFQGNLSRPTPIQDAYGRPWDALYARGDFSTFDEPGTYRLRVQIDETVAESEPFEIVDHLLWDQILPVALEYLDYMASAEDIPNFHGPWHLDDALDPETGAQLDLAGGWYDDGRFAKRDNVEILTCLADAWQVAAWKLRDYDANRDGTPDVAAAIARGGDYVQKLATAGPSAYTGVAEKPGFLGDPGQQTDNQPGTGDERAAIAGGRDDDMAYALALASAATEGAYLEAAATLAARARGADVETPDLFAAAILLHQQTEDAQWGELCKAILPDIPGTPWLAYTEPLIAYESAFGTALSVQLAIDHMSFAEALRGLAANPFGVVTYGPPDAPHFFAPAVVPADEAVGNTPYLLRMALAVARAHRFSPSVELRTFVYDQLNWLLGNNPAGISLIEGLGRTHLPAYHSQLVFSGIERGALPGGIANGFVPRGAGDGRPYIDLRPIDLPDWRTNACATKNAALLIDVIANLKRADFLNMRAPKTK